MRSMSRGWLALALGGALVVAACGGPAATTAPTAAPPTAAPTDGSTPGPTEMPGTKEFKIAFTSPGLSTAPFLAAIDALNKSGYTIEYTVLDASELLAEGTSKGDFAFASGANNGILAAVEKGANLRAITARVNNEWTLYVRSATIKQCSDLQGQRLAIHSQGAVSTAMVRDYIKVNCPGTEPNYVVIEGSTNRLAALIADQIDASPLELSDSITIEAQAGDRFSLLASFAADVPNLQTTSVYVNGDFAAANPGTVVALIKALLDQHRQIDGNAAYLRQIAETFVPDAVNAETIGASTSRYVDLKMFPVDGGLTAEKMQYTAEFFGPNGTGATSRVLALDEWTDLSFLEMALAQ